MAGLAYEPKEAAGTDRIKGVRHYSVYSFFLLLFRVFFLSLFLLFPALLRP